MSKFVFLKSLRELLVPLKRLIDKKAEAPNWNENDPASASYIANRTHYKEEKEKFYLNNEQISFSNGGPFYVGEVNSIDGTLGDIFTIVWDGIKYQCKVGLLAEDFYTLGNQSIASVIFGTDLPDTGEPFLYAFFPEEYANFFTLSTASSHTVSLFGIGKIIHKIPIEYLPEISNVGKEGTGENAEIFNDYEENEASGDYSHAEGFDTTASGDYSHAEGYNTDASGDNSHAEGNYTQATEWSSHAEGSGTWAKGENSHAEGSATTASGFASHSEGHRTVASSQYQHVQGQYNIEDSNNKYAHIVGNGTGSSKRKNAHTLDWNGLGWFAGGVKVGGTGQDDANAKTLATEAYVDNKIAEIPTPDVSGQIETAIASLVDTAPETLNTLNELANALGDDPNFATTVSNQLGTLKTQIDEANKQITEPKNAIVFIDQVNGYHYIACMREGNFVTYCATKSIEIITMPNKTEYIAGEYFDPTGMIVMATAYDGTTNEITDYTYHTDILTEDTTEFEITYNEFGEISTTKITLTISPFDPAVQLVDFEYTVNENGTYTLTGWKETLNGETSTEMIIPNNGLIVL